MNVCVFFLFKRKTAYEMRISDWSSDVCSSDLDELIAPSENPKRKRTTTKAVTVETRPVNPVKRAHNSDAITNIGRAPNRSDKSPTGIWAIRKQTPKEESTTPKSFARIERDRKRTRLTYNNKCENRLQSFA